MALAATQINGDTTFLLTFTPTFAPHHPTPTQRTRFPGDFAILLDPWLHGQACILHPAFQISHHTYEPSTTSLNDLADHFDLIVISQDKPDHCNRETLCALSKEKQVDIVATPAAAKKIRSWKYFDPDRIIALPPYKPDDASTVIRIPLLAYSSGKAGGMVTIANIPTKRDVAGLHNAIGITYQPPDSHYSINPQWDRFEPGTTVQLSSTGFTRPPSRPKRPRTGSDTLAPVDKKTLRKSVSYPYLPQAQPTTTTTATPPATSHHRVDSAHSTPKPPPNREKPLSVLYTPHGLSPATLTPYILTHLLPHNAYPPAALFHSMNMEQNPWFMGGRVMDGAPGGLELMRYTGARNWISAHDEAKELKGLAVALLKSTRFDVEDVTRLMEVKGLEGRRAMRLGVGETVRVEVER